MVRPRQRSRHIPRPAGAGPTAVALPALKPSTETPAHAAPAPQAPAAQPAPSRPGAPASAEHPPAPRLREPQQHHPAVPVGAGLGVAAIGLLAALEPRRRAAARRRAPGTRPALPDPSSQPAALSLRR